MDDGSAFKNFIDKMKNEIDGLGMNTKDLILRSEIFKKIKGHTDWDDEKVDFFLKTENPNFGYISPDHMIKLGRGERLRLLINSMINVSREL